MIDGRWLRQDALSVRRSGTTFTQCVSETGRTQWWKQWYYLHSICVWVNDGSSGTNFTPMCVWDRTHSVMEAVILPSPNVCVRQDALSGGSSGTIFTSMCVWDRTHSVMEAVILPSLNVCLRQDELSGGSSSTTFTQCVSRTRQTQWWKQWYCLHSMCVWDRTHSVVEAVVLPSPNVCLRQDALSGGSSGTIFTSMCVWDRTHSVMEAVVLTSLNVCLRQDALSGRSSGTTFTQYVSESMMEAVVLTSLNVCLRQDALSDGSSGTTFTQCVSETGRTQWWKQWNVARAKRNHWDAIKLLPVLNGNCTISNILLYVSFLSPGNRQCHRYWKRYLLAMYKCATCAQRYNTRI